jgi:F0F1-type ATP synthase assembly protein I
MSRTRLLGLFLGFLLGALMAYATPYFLVAVFTLIGIALLAANIYILWCAI